MQIVIRLLEFMAFLWTLSVRFPSPNQRVLLLLREKPHRKREETGALKTFNRVSLIASFFLFGVFLNFYSN